MPSRNAEEMRAFIGAMHVVAEPQARKIVAAVKDIYQSLLSTVENKIKVK